MTTDRDDEPAQVMQTLRFPVALLARATALVPYVARKAKWAPTGHASRALVLRIALDRGLDVLEREQQAEARKKGGV